MCLLNSLNSPCLKRHFVRASIFDAAHTTIQAVTAHWRYPSETNGQLDGIDDRPVEQTRKMLMCLALYSNCRNAFGLSQKCSVRISACTDLLIREMEFASRNGRKQIAHKSYTNCTQKSRTHRHSLVRHSN